MKNLNKILIALAVLLVVVGVLFLTVVGTGNFGPGLADYTVDLQNSCSLTRTSVHSVSVMCDEVEGVPPKVLKLGWNENYVLALTNPVIVNENDYNNYKTPDLNTTYWWIIDIKNKKPYGPIESEELFKIKLRELDVPSNIPFITPDQAKPQSS